MPLFLVRWPDLSAALVKAQSEDDLLDKLDEVANPEGCTWSLYRGPLFIEFSLPVTFDVGVREGRSESGPLDPADIVVHDVSRLQDAKPLNLVLPDCETSSEMSDAIEKKAFPHVFKARRDSGEEPPRVAELRQAVEKELECLVRASWKEEHVTRRGDPESRTAAQMGTSVRLLRWWRQGATKKPKA